jgi:hypothetical protein
VRGLFAVNFAAAGRSIQSPSGICMSRTKKFAPASAPVGIGEVGEGSKIGLFVASIARHGNLGFTGCERIGG